MDLQDNYCDNKIKDLTPDDVLVNPDDPLGTRNVFQVVYPDTNCTKGVVESPKRTTVLGGSQATEQREHQSQSNHKQKQNSRLFRFCSSESDAAYKEMLFWFLNCSGVAIHMAPYLQEVYATIDKAPTKKGKKSRAVKMVCI